MSRINTNVASLNAQRNIGQTNQAFGRVVGRLSSGFRINRAADDAAGLGIANKLRGDIRALSQANRNATQANSLLQVAEGATNQISNIVDRMKELAAQSASDSVNNDSRALIQAEFTQLQEELTRIVDTTRFQGTELLAGGGTPTGLTDGTAGVQTALDALTGVASASVAVADAEDLAAGGYTITAAISGTTLTFTLSDGTTEDDHAVTLDGSGDVTSGGSVSLNVGTLTVGFTASGAGNDIETAFGSGFSIGVDTEGGELQFLVSVSGNGTDGSGGAGQDFVTINTQNLTLEALGLATASLGERDDAVAAIEALDSAVETISAALGEIGAAQNRIDFASANVATMIENFSAAESVIRDADFAAEASEFARLQILMQSQIAMLAQANSAPQSVLQLLS